MNTKERLSVVAARMFAERGYHGTSIGDLAADIGVQKATIYSHITGKQDLLAEITTAGAAAFHAALDAIPDDAAPDEKLQLALAGHFGVVDRQLHIATVWLQEWRYLEGDARTSFLAERRRYQRRVKKLFTEAVDAGALRSDLEVDRATLIFLSVGNWAYTWMTHRTKVGPEAEMLWRLLRDGLGES